MTKEELEKKIKEILKKDDRFRKATFKVTYQSNKKLSNKIVRSS